MKDLQEEIATLKCQLKAKEEELYKLSMKKVINNLHFEVMFINFVIF